MNIDFSKLSWIFDRYGDDVGYPDVSVVSVYELEQYGLTLLIDVDDIRILEAHVKAHKNMRMEKGVDIVKVDDAFLNVIHNALKEMKIIYD